jgi:hypothetical protein
MTGHVIVSTGPAGVLHADATAPVMILQRDH